MLANGLRQSEAAGKISGIKLGANGPAISHLLFADDSIFFIKATKEEASELKSILNTYERLSGQKVNLAKSSITFGSKVTTGNKHNLHFVLPISAQGEQGIYLGLPEAFIGSKIATLSFLEKRISTRVNSWKNRYLSQGGKETLLKAVVLALPTYTMSCFKLPKRTVGRITSEMAKFWWKNQKITKGIHWHSWSKLTKHKKEGGLGMRDIEGFNQALLGKQIWRIANNHQPLLARVLKSRYFPSVSILNSKVGTRPSYAWRSIFGAQCLMKRGMYKCFGSGEHIDILKDLWIVDPEPRALVLKAGIDPSSVSISTIKLFDSEEWNVRNLRYLFEESEVHQIMKVYSVAYSSDNPSFSWIHTKNGDYTVKSGYWIWSRHLSSSHKPSLSPLYEAIWKVKAPPKIQHFLWRSITGSLAVGDRLAAKKMIKDPDCPRCGQGKETINHTLFECGFARLIWASSPAGFLYFPQPATSVYSNLATCLLMQDPDNSEINTRIRSWPWLLWRIWKARNELCFTDHHEQMLQIVHLAEEDARGWDIANTKTIIPKAVTPVQGNISTSSTSNWQKPSVGMLKCNIDGSWKVNSTSSGVGWILRNDLGKIKWYGMKSYPQFETSLEAEAAALVWAMKVLDNLRVTNVIFEMDCRDLFLAINQPHNWNRLRVFLDEICKRRQALRPIFKLCSRTTNSTADLLAKKARSCQVYSADLTVLVPLG